MAYRLEHHGPEWAERVARCNSRLTASGAPFLLPVRPAAAGAIRREHWLVVDSDYEVRGGCLLQFHPAWLAEATVEVANLQSPLSEGIGDRRHAAVGPYMMRAVTRSYPYSYSVGAGGEDMPYMRLARALRWNVSTVPFFFRVLHGRRFLRHMQPLQRAGLLGLLARMAASMPLAADVAFEQLHRLRTRVAATPAGVVAPEWTSIRSRYGFGLERTPQALDALYPPGDPRFHRIAVSGGSAVLAYRDFHHDRYFGDLRVLTLVEMLVASGAEGRLLSAVLAFAVRTGADLLVTNQSAPELCQALRSAGWLPHASNYCVALAPALAERTGGRSIYVNRGDGDGLLNL